MPGKDFYAILGVGRGASDKEIRSAYRKLARKLHPDVNPGDKAGEARFKEINEAYQVLSEPEKRKKYDQYGEHWEQAEQFSRAGAEATGTAAGAGASNGHSYRWGGGAPGGRPGAGAGGGPRTPFGDLGDFGSGFEGIFDRFTGRGGSRTRSERGQDLEHPVDIMLEEAYNGATRMVQLETEEVCVACNGAGTVKSAVCALCGGAGVAPRVRRLEVKIPAGVKDGARVRLSGEGGAGTGGAPRGDLFLLVSVRPHDRFERRGDDLY
ncbi:MAG: J domain-containing protein, partial [Chloroflexi bacterium]|nr:J domain-containing protein [Chloroflexota bacterium]